MSESGNEVLAALTVFVVLSVALVHAWDKYWDARARAREGLLRHERVDGAAASVGVVEREAAVGERALLDHGRLD
jgi:hypothetical protein